MKILITGGAGFIGSHLCETFLKKGYSVIVVDNLSHRIVGYQRIIKGAKFYRVDIKDIFSLKNIFLKERPQVINHQAAIASTAISGIEVFQTNVLGTINLLELAKKFKVKKFIFASSAAVYGKQNFFPIKENSKLNPISQYGISKLTAEFYLHLYEKYFQVIILRYSNVYGLRQDSKTEGGVISIFYKNILNGKNCLIYGDGKQTRDFIYVRDIVDANLKTLTYFKNGIFNISSNKEINILELIKLLNKVIGKKANFKLISSRAGDINKSLLDNTKARKILFWRPKIELEKGFNIMIKNEK